MKVIALFASILFLLTLITLHLSLANSVYKSKPKHSQTFTNKSMLDTFTYPSKYSYIVCKHQSRRNSSIGKIIRCQSYIESTLKEVRSRRRLLFNRKFIRKILKSMNTPRCGVRDVPLLYSAGNRW